MPVCITRFSDTTFNERYLWCKKHNYNGTIYGSPVKINSTILPETKLIVLEMNNTINKIVGIGIIINRLNYDNHKYKLYSDNNYNRYIYKSDKYIDINAIDNIDNSYSECIKQLEMLLFKGRRNYKRGQGIQRIPLYIREIEHLDIEAVINRLVNKLV